MIFQKFAQLFTQFLYRNRKIGVDKDRTQYCRSSTRPVLKRLFYKILYRENQTTLIPNINYYISKINFFDFSPFSFYNQHIINTYGLGKCNLKSSQKIPK